MALTSQNDPSKDKSVSNENEAGAPGSGDAKGLGIGLAKEVGGLEAGQMKIVEVSTGRSFVFSGAIEVYRNNTKGEVKKYLSSSTDIFQEMNSETKSVYTHYVIG